MTTHHNSQSSSRFTFQFLSRWLLLWKNQLKSQLWHDKFRQHILCFHCRILKCHFRRLDIEHEVGAKCIYSYSMVLLLPSDLHYCLLLAIAHTSRYLLKVFLRAQQTQSKERKEKEGLGWFWFPWWKGQSQVVIRAARL